MSTKRTEPLLPVILNGAAGGVKDLGPQLRLVILNEVKDLGLDNKEHNRFFAAAQNDRETLRMTGGRHVRRQYPIHSLSGIFPAHISMEQWDDRDRMMKKDTDVGIIL